MQWMGRILHSKHFAWHVWKKKEDILKKLYLFPAVENLLTWTWHVPGNADLIDLMTVELYHAQWRRLKAAVSISFIYVRRSRPRPNVIQASPDSALSLSCRAPCAARSRGSVFIAAVLNAFACYSDPEITVYPLFQDGLRLRRLQKANPAPAAGRGTCGYLPVQTLILLQRKKKKIFFPFSFFSAEGLGPWRTVKTPEVDYRGDKSPSVRKRKTFQVRQWYVMSVSLCVWHAMGAVLSWFTFHLSGFLLETVDIFKRCGVSNTSCRSQFTGPVIPPRLCLLISNATLLRRIRQLHFW